MTSQSGKFGHMYGNFKHHRDENQEGKVINPLPEKPEGFNTPQFSRFQ